MTSIPFSIPSQFAEGLANGSIQRFGTILKETGTGKIVAHLQESGLAQKLLSSSPLIPFSPLGALEAVSSVGANLQLVQLKSMIEGLHVLQFANLGATVAGIGVSAAGFALMNYKLNKIHSQISEFALRVDEQFIDLRESRLREHQSSVMGFVAQAEHAHLLSSPGAEYLRIASALAGESDFYQGEIQHFLDQKNFDTKPFSAMVQLLALSNGARLRCLVMAQELEYARSISSQIASVYSGLFEPLKPISLAKRSIYMLEESEQTYDDLLRQSVQECANLVINLRDTHDAASTTPFLVDTLRDQGVDGHDYVHQLMEEEKEPILLLAA